MSDTTVQAATWTRKLLSAALVSAVAVTACGDGTAARNNNTTDTTAQHSPSSSTSAPGYSRSVDSVDFDSDTFDQDAEFWASMAVTAFEIERYESIEEMTTEATAVVLGKVVSEADSRVVSDPDTDDSVRYPAFNIEVVEVLAGDLPTGEGLIRLETIIEPKSPLASGLALMFIRWKGETPSGNEEIDKDERLAYRLVSSQGIFIQGPDGRARNPLSEAMKGFLEDDPLQPADPVLRDVGDRSLEQLIAEVESVVTG